MEVNNSTYIIELSEVYLNQLHIQHLEQSQASMQYMLTAAPIATTNCFQIK